MTTMSVFQIKGPMAMVGDHVVATCDQWIRLQDDDKKETSHRKIAFLNHEPLVGDLCDLYYAFEQCHIRQQIRKATLEEETSLEQLCSRVMNQWGNACLARFDHFENKEDEQQMLGNDGSTFRDNTCTGANYYYDSDTEDDECKEDIDSMDDEPLSKKQKTHLSAGGPDQLIDSETARVMDLCNEHQWSSVLDCMKQKPSLATVLVSTKSRFKITALHLAITNGSKILPQESASSILRILQTYPEAASIANSKGVLPLFSFVFCKSVDVVVKEQVLRALIQAYPAGLLHANGKYGRTPLHALMTRNAPIRLLECLLEMEQGVRAAYKKDNHGYLPIHLACHNHCSPEHVHLLLKANPCSLTEKTNEGFTILALAMRSSSMNKSNKALIEEIRKALGKENATAKA